MACVLLPDQRVNRGGIDAIKKPILLILWLFSLNLQYPTCPNKFNSLHPRSISDKQLRINNMSIFKNREDETIFISTQGLEHLIKTYDPKQGNRNILWTTDYNVELPIRIKKQGPGSEAPKTLIEQFLRVVAIKGNLPALSEKQDGQWKTLTYREYFEECMDFGRSLVELGYFQAAINIIGFNAPEWSIAFFGSLFARCLPVGIYTTNSPATCAYIAEHSDCKVVIAENMAIANKYVESLKRGVIDYIILYKESKIEGDNHGGRIMLWKEFMTKGKRVERATLEKRMKSVKPGNCCTLVYTSGTTGMPKAVMLSHDNYTWITHVLLNRRPKVIAEQQKVVSYLPLSHVAGQTQDITGAMIDGWHVYFAEPSALSGTLIQTLKEVRPTIFFSVPRVWEKIEESMKQMAKSNGWLKTKIATWAKEKGPECINEFRNQDPSISYKIAKSLVFDNIKKALGLDQAEFMVFGAAPLNPDTRQYFLSLGFPLANVYGMSECTGPQTLTNEKHLEYEKSFMKEAGTALPGTQLKIVPDNPHDAEGEICYRGRHIFMGYYKNPEETAKAIDSEGFLHSGDVGKLNKDGVLFITGRLKQLIITAAGENIPPVLIENAIKEVLPIVSNVMVVGDRERFLSALVTLKQEPDGRLAINCKDEYERIGTEAKTVKQAKSCPKVYKAISVGIQKANEKAISRAQKVQTFAILEEDFTVENELLTPTLKLKRKQVLQRYDPIVKSFYTNPKL